MNLRLILFCLVIIFSWPVAAQHQLSLSKDERLYQKGQELIAHSNFGAARQVFTEFLANTSSTDARRSEAEYYIAFTALNLGHTDGEKLIDQFMADHPSSPRAATAYYDLADFFYNEKSYVKASTYYKKVNFPALDKGRQDEGHFKWGYSYFSQKKLDEALEQFNFVKKQSSPYSPAANYYAGFVEYSKGQYEEALTDLRKAETNSSYATVVPYLIANVYYKQAKYDELIQYGNAIKGRADIANSTEVSMLIAEAYYFKGDYKNAADAYEKFLKENPDKAQSALLLRAGYANYALKQDGKAIDYLSKSAASRDSASYYASYYLGILYVKQGEKPLALNAFDFARRSPTDKRLAEEAWFQYGKVSYDAGKPDQAIAEFEKFLKLYPTGAHTTEVKEILAQAYVNGNNYNKAIEYIEGLPKRTPYIDQAYQKASYLKGSELFNKEQYAEAVSHFEKSLEYKNDPVYVALASFWAAEAYAIGIKYAEAVRHYETVLGLGAGVDPEILRKTRYGLGYAFFSQKIYDRALFNFKEFVARSNKNTPNYVDGLIRLADSYYVSKQYGEALNYYTQARNIGSPDNDYILLQTGVISGIQRKYSESRTLLSSMIQNYPKSRFRDEALYQRAQFDIEQGNYQQAIDGLTQLIREEPNSQYLPLAYERRAASYFNVKQYDKSVADYSALMNQFPTHPMAKEALIPMQEALNMAGRAGDFGDVLAKHKKSNPDDKNLEAVEYTAATALYFNQQYRKAVTDLGSFIAGYPQSARLQEARYYMAESYYRLGETDKALPVYIELGKDLGFDRGSKVVARIAEIQFKQGKYSDAVASFHRLERVATTKKEQASALSGLMESFYLLAQYDSSDVYARAVLDRGNATAGGQNKASLHLGKTAFAREDYETAKDELLNTLNAAQDEYGAEAKYLLAQIFFLKKEHKQCYETLTSLISDFSAYNEWVGKAFLLLADNFLAQGNTFQYKATLQSLIDGGFPLKPVTDEAKRKLAAIEQAETEKKKKIEADTLDN